ncbi:MAG: hypothetical protein M1824_004367 [Vezdaea acicularis]|nr:MAG: hypothetical protein M1824_004367 [Vezdaea acicularis]
MDPLSVAASIVGLLTAAAKISSVLRALIGDARETVSAMQAMSFEVAEVHTALTQLQSFLLAPDRVPRSRACMIQLQSVVITLTHCVTTFSELEVLVRQFEEDVRKGTGLFTQWNSKGTRALELLRRLQNHKASLTFLLSIISCQSTKEAHESVEQLNALVSTVLESNQEILNKISAMEIKRMASTTRSKARSISSANIDTKTIAPRKPMDSMAAVMDAKRSNTYPSGFTFDGDLQQSRVYRRARKRKDVFSISSAGAYSVSWSVFSGLSLSDISNIAAITLPIVSKDISNSALYQFGGLPPIVESGRETPVPNIEKELPPLPPSELDVLSTVLAHTDRTGDGYVSPYAPEELLRVTDQKLLDRSKLSYTCGQIYEVIEDRGAYWLARIQRDVVRSDGRAKWVTARRLGLIYKQDFWNIAGNLSQEKIISIKKRVSAKAKDLADAPHKALSLLGLSSELELLLCPAAMEGQQQQFMLPIKFFAPRASALRLNPACPLAIVVWNHDGTTPEICGEIPLVVARCVELIRRIPKLAGFQQLKRTTTELDISTLFGTPSPDLNEYIQENCTIDEALVVLPQFLKDASIPAIPAEIYTAFKKISGIETQRVLLHRWPPEFPEICAVLFAKAFVKILREQVSRKDSDLLMYLLSALYLVQDNPRATSALLGAIKPLSKLRVKLMNVHEDDFVRFLFASLAKQFRLVVDLYNRSEDRVWPLPGRLVLLEPWEKGWTVMRTAVHTAGVK